MSRAAKTFVTSLVALALLALAATAASADFGFKPDGLDVTFTNRDGSVVTQAGSHPFAMTTSLAVNTTVDPGTHKEVPDGGEVKELKLRFPPGFVGTPDAVPHCLGVDFLAESCPDSTALGVVKIVIGFEGPGLLEHPVYNLQAAPGDAAKLGFITIANIPVTIDIGVAPTQPHNVIARVTNIPQSAFFYASDLTVWGNPADKAHDPDRGKCLGRAEGCPTSVPEVPFFTLPRSCSGPLDTVFEMSPWLNPVFLVKAIGETEGMTGCGRLGFAPRIASRATTDRASSPSGLDFDIEIADEGLTSPPGIADSDIRKAVVTLPPGMTANPSLAEGLATCSSAGFERETVGSAFGDGCPAASKIGSVEVESPLLEGELIKGQVYIATPYENPFNSLLALYMVIKDPELGLLVKLPGRVDPVEGGPEAGRLTTTFGEAPYEVPQIPISNFRFHFREGGRSPLITPPACGKYTTTAVFTPWANPSNPLTATAVFEVTSGVGGGPCPPAGPPPFVPGFSAGTLSNNNAGSYSPFYMRLTRRDGDQDMTKFSSILPPGVLASLVGVSKCPDAAITAAKARTGPHGGTEELGHPSCPANSQIGRTLTGAGIGSQLTYVGGSLYLAGPYQGAPLSVVAIVPGVAGPFDVGTIVVRIALRFNPVTAEAEADGRASDPIPHILRGIPLKVRDIRAYVDRPNWIFNPTSCDPSSTRATLWGSAADVFDPADDMALERSSRYQAANCLNLGFKPRLSLQLKGATRRGGFPALRGTFLPRSGDANLKGLVLRLPHSAFLEQSHIRTICTRVQFAARSCPKGAIYGHARAFTPLLEEPLEGPVYLRSSSNPLPDFVADLHGLVDIEAVARIDSKNGGIRATFADTPDAPLTKVVVNMQGGKKGLIVNSVDLCAHTQRANASFAGHNGRRHEIRPKVVAMGCKKGKKGKAKRSAHSAARR